VAVRRGHARIRGGIALEDADTAPGLVCVDVKRTVSAPTWIGSAAVLGMG
jgi:hypothetical protein